MQRVEFRAMGCQMVALLASDTPSSASLLEQTPAWFEAWEQALSRFHPDSELNRLNCSQGRWFYASETLWAVLQAAFDTARLTDGLVTPTVLDAIEAIGYDRSFELIRTEWVTLSLRPTAIPDWRTIETDPQRHAIRLPDGVRLDVSGVAKGWAAQQAAQRLSVAGLALVDAGGDIAIAPLDADDEPFVVGIADPWQPNDLLTVVTLSAGGVATSGRDYRRWHVAGVPYHHILDPRTAAPVDTDVLTATVIASDALRAEAAAKAALILGSVDGLAWIETQPDMAALLTLEDGRVMRSRRFMAFEWQPESEVTQP